MKSLGNPSSLRTLVLKEFNDLDTVRPLWKSLLNHPNADPDVFMLIARHRKEIRRPHIIVLYDADRPVSMVIGRVIDHRIECSIGYFSFSLPRLRVLTLLYGGFLGEQTERTAAAVMAALRQSLDTNEADALYFNSLPTRSPLFARVTTDPPFVCRNHIASLQVHHEMAVPAKRQDFFKNMNSKHRTHMKKKYEKLEYDFPGAVSWKFHQAVEDIRRLSGDSETIARQTYHRGLGIGFICNAESMERLALTASQGRLLSPVLYVNAKPCAFIIGELFKDRYYLNYVGYDPAYAKYSPGIILLIKIMETLCDAYPSIQFIDFGFGDADYKQRFSSGTWQESSVYVFARRIGPVGINIVRIAVLCVAKTLQGVAHKLNLEAHLKKLWRNKAREKKSS
ncbi:MAG: GNAT family N-acetyltransferase [Chitinispirillaceae bacterium]|nr:GNAT family N-acetyltransferase [Chitinispirillaceae bacterium]